MWIILISIVTSPLLKGEEFECPTEGTATNTTYINTTITLKILLVEFSDVGHRTDPFEYIEQDFEDMLTSIGTYVSPVSYTPDGDAVYGSLHDYFNKMSSGNVTITGYVVNNIGTGDVPEWITLSDTKSYYYSRTGIILFTNAIAAASAQGLDVSTPDEFTRLVIIYSGNTYFKQPSGQFSSLNPKAWGRKYIMSERQGRPYNQENTTDKFSRIGLHCHEFAHTIGIDHARGSRADVMEAGYRNGPGARSAAPAPINPAYRAKKGWLSPNTITGQQQFDAYYDLINPTVFRINSNTNNDYYLFENRRFNQSMVIGSTEAPDYYNSVFFPPAHPHETISQGIFVWRIIGGDPTSYSNNGLVYSSGMYEVTCPEGDPYEAGDGVPFPGNCTVTVLSPWSDPRTPTPWNPPNSGLYVPNTRNGTNVGMEVVSENESQGFFTVMLYQTNPEDAKPSRPQNFQAVNLNGHPRMTWDSNLEPDLSGYRLYKYLETWSSGADTFVISIHEDSIGYTDEWFDTGGRKPWDKVTYWMSALDDQGKESDETEDFSFTGSSGVQWKQVAETASAIPQVYYLSENFPNPFNPTTSIRYDLPEPSYVSVVIYDILGREVRTLLDSREEAGFKSVVWDSKDNGGNIVSAGIYIYTLRAWSQESEKIFHKTNKMIFLK